jgi:hypothetical protein
MTITLATTYEEPEIIDINQDIDMIINGDQDGDMIEGSHPIHKPLHKPVKWACEGIYIAFPEGKNEHTSYPQDQPCFAPVKMYFQ